MENLTLLHSRGECETCVLRHGNDRDSVCMGLKGTTLHHRMTPEGLRWKRDESCPLIDGVVLISARKLRVAK